MFGFLLPMRFFSDRIASLGWTVFDRIRSEISRLVAISSRLEDVAFSICSSRGEAEVNQLAIFVCHFSCYVPGSQTELLAR